MPGLTPVLTVNCSYSRTPDSDMITVTALTITDASTNDIVISHIDVYDSAKASAVGDDTTALGILDGLHGGYLTLVWLHPKPAHQVLFQCKATGIGSSGQIISVNTVSPLLSDAEVTTMKPEAVTTEGSHGKDCQ